MISRKVTMVVLAALALIASACGSTVQTPPPLSVNDAALTLVAATFEAATRSAKLQAPTPLPPPAASPTAAKAFLYIVNDAKCRTGTTPNFKVVIDLGAGTNAELVGKDTPQSAWLIKVPNSTDTCWVQAQDASPSGGFESLPEVTPQVSNLHPPNSPAILGWPWICSYVDGVIYSATVNLSWVDPSHDANGFRVYRSDTQIADVPATTTTFTDTTNVAIGTPLTYFVQAYNDGGVSPRAKQTINSMCK